MLLQTLGAQGQFRVWLSSHTPETFQNAVAACLNGLEIPQIETCGMCTGEHLVLLHQRLNSF